jgi:hypothetical protein
MSHRYVKSSLTKTFVKRYLSRSIHFSSLLFLEPPLKQRVGSSFIKTTYIENRHSNLPESWDGVLAYISGFIVKDVACDICAQRLLETKQQCH